MEKGESYVGVGKANKLVRLDSLTPRFTAEYNHWSFADSPPSLLASLGKLEVDISLR